MMLKLNILLLLSIIGIASGQHDPHFAPGRTVMVQLFEWRWNDIANECENFLSPYGYAGVQVSPVSENAIVQNPSWPWYERYQPVSYNVMTTRSGTEEEFASMVKRCNQVGVRIYVDAVLNHMTGKDMSGYGSGGSFYDASLMNFPEYSANDFNGPHTCHSSSGEIENWNDEHEVRNCRLVGLVDLDQSKEWTRDHIAEFLNKLVNYGVAGFRIDAAKHMYPAQLKEIFDRVRDLPTDHGFAPGSRPFIFQEVQPGSDTEPIQNSHYYANGRVTEFKYGKYLGELFRGYNQLKWLVNFGVDWGMGPHQNALIFTDNHDTQRGHGGGGIDITLTFRQSKMYKMANAFMLAHPYGVARVMSSYYWDLQLENGVDKNDWVGPPHSNGETLPVIINPDMTCGNGWICEHRWRQIFHMVEFSNVVRETGLNDWWDNGNNQIAFCRGDKGFIAINNDDHPLQTKLQTCLPEGLYCEVISGAKVGDSCSGNTITVGSDGKADIYISNTSEDPIIAIHAESKL